VTSAAGGETQICPACGGENPADAVFCEHPPCHKALGGFKYVTEELIAEARWHEALAERTTAFIGKPHFLFAHAVWFAIWIAINTGIVMGVTKFDTYPFALLGIILAAEAIFITGFLLVTQNRQNAHANKRAELDYEVNVRTYREIARIEAKIDALITRFDARKP
jgi:uncharacterized membrane protein